MKTKLFVFIPAIFTLIGFSCEKNDDSFAKLDCVKGNYLGQYCSGAIVQILDDHKIGKDWDSIFGDESYKNAALASIDTLLIKQGYKPTSFFSQDSIFYFQYIDGGYPRKTFENCEPTPFITITYVSKQPCNNE